MFCHRDYTFIWCTFKYFKVVFDFVYILVFSMTIKHTFLDLNELIEQNFFYLFLYTYIYIYIKGKKNIFRCFRNKIVIKISISSPYLVC